MLYARAIRAVFPKMVRGIWWIVQGKAGKDVRSAAVTASNPTRHFLQRNRRHSLFNLRTLRRRAGLRRLEQMIQPRHSSISKCLLPASSSAFRIGGRFWVGSTTSSSDPLIASTGHVTCRSAVAGS